MATSAVTYTGKPPMTSFRPPHRQSRNLVRGHRVELISSSAQPGGKFDMIRMAPKILTGGLAAQPLLRHRHNVEAPQTSRLARKVWIGSASAATFDGGASPLVGPRREPEGDDNMGLASWAGRRRPRANQFLTLVALAGSSPRLSTPVRSTPINVHAPMAVTGNRPPETAHV